MARRRRDSPTAYSFLEPKQDKSIRYSARLNPCSSSGTTGSIRSYDTHPQSRGAEPLTRSKSLRRHSRISHSLKRASDNHNLPNSKRRRTTFPTPPPSTKVQDQRRELTSATTKAEQDSPAHVLSRADTLGTRKRKRSCDVQDQHKRAKPCVTQEPIGTIGTDLVSSGEIENQTAADPVAYWASEHHWPKDFTTMDQPSSGSSRKRPAGWSYSQSYRDGEVPKAHTRAYENELAKNNVYMDITKGRTFVSKESELLCESLLKGSYPEPEHTQYPLAKFTDVWQRVQSHNETRLFRDITPLLVPSPELLCVCGHEKLEHVTETLNVEWNKIKTLGGPSPKPDQVIGLTQSAFNDEEIAKLRNHTSFERATAFGETVYFPFLLIEAKSGDDGINKADRQNMHSSSIALNAILELYLVLQDGRSKAAALNGEILLFSISHDNERVKLFGHFAVVDKEKVSFYRYYFEDFVLNIEARQGRKKTHDFVRAVYDVFYPDHLARIKKALAEMRDPREQSMKSNRSFDDTDSQDLAPSASASQETAQFKTPSEPASKKQKDLIDLLTRQLEQQRKESEERQKELMQMLKEALQKR